MVGHSAQAACSGLSGRRGRSDGVPASRARAPSELSGQHVVLGGIAWLSASLISPMFDGPKRPAFNRQLLFITSASAGPTLSRTLIPPQRRMRAHGAHPGGRVPCQAEPGLTPRHQCCADCQARSSPVQVKTMTGLAGCCCADTRVPCCRRRRGASIPGQCAAAVAPYLDRHRGSSTVAPIGGQPSVP